MHETLSMKLNPLFATALLAATTTAACKREQRSRDELLASARAAQHPSAELLDRLPIAQQELLLGPPLANSKRVRALIAPKDLTLGPVDAPVVLIAFVDFGVSDGDPVAALIDVQRAHAKDVRIAIKPVVGSDPGSREAAQAIVAATAQGKGWELAACASRPGAPGALLGIGSCTATIDLDMKKYAADLSNVGVTLADNAAAVAHLAVTRSPTLFLNGYRIKGVPPQDDLERGVQSSIAHAWALAGSQRLERAQIYPQLMRTASIPSALSASELN
jgi:protein-disulfide isomerase